MGFTVLFDIIFQTNIFDSLVVKLNRNTPSLLVYGRTDFFGSDFRVHKVVVTQ